MGSIVGAAIGLGGSLLGSSKQSSASNKATQRQEDVAAANIQFLAEEGVSGANILRDRLGQSREVLGQIPQAAIAPIQPFADIGGRGFDVARQSIMDGGSPDALTQAVSDAGFGAVAGRRGFDLSGPVGAATRNQAELFAQGLQPEISQQLLSTVGRAGVGAAGDIASILARRGETAGNIEQQVGAQQAAALLGQVAPVSQQIQAGQEARILGQASNQAQGAQLAETLARAAGRFL